ncbi:MAG: hypothetical protein PHH57_08600 [Candidatus Omnitrophica bacterium]|jgi:hypothetical protein|nr:hypothetical protein [Candidatus Omnitrophota bacterium]
MKKPKKALNFFIDKDLYNKVNEYRHKHKIDTIAETVRRLIQKGLEQG